MTSLNFHVLQFCIVYGMSLNYFGRKRQPMRLRWKRFAVRVALGLALLVSVVSVGAAGDYVWVQSLSTVPEYGSITFGNAMDISSDGNHLVVAQIQGVQTGQGVLHVYKRSGNQWLYEVSLLAPATKEPEGLGRSVAISDDGRTIAAGAWMHNKRRGAVYVFVKEGNTWREQVRVAEGFAPDTLLGNALDLSADGNTLAIGETRYPNLRTGGGAIHIYTRSGDTWTKQAQLIGTGIVAGDQFGHCISISADGNTILAGVYRANSVGAAYIFTRKGTTWTETAILQPEILQPGDGFGIHAAALSKDGRVALVGAILHDAFNSKALLNAGAAFVFTNTDDEWSLAQRLVPADPVFAQHFGTTVAISETGDIAAVRGRESSKGYIFKREGDTWHEIFAQSQSELRSELTSVAMDANGDVVVMSAPDAGLAEPVAIFVLSDNIDLPPAITSTTPANNALFIPSDTPITINFSEPVNFSADSFAVLCGGAPVSFTVNESPAMSAVLTPSQNWPANTNCIIRIGAANISDADTNDPPDNMIATYIFSFITAPPLPK